MFDYINISTIVFVEFSLPEATSMEHCFTYMAIHVNCIRNVVTTGCDTVCRPGVLNMYYCIVTLLFIMFIDSLLTNHVQYTVCTMNSTFCYLLYLLWN